MNYSRSGASARIALSGATSLSAYAAARANIAFETENTSPVQKIEISDGAALHAGGSTKHCPPMKPGAGGMNELHSPGVASRRTEMNSKALTSLGLGSGGIEIGDGEQGSHAAALN